MVDFLKSEYLEENIKEISQLLFGGTANKTKNKGYNGSSRKNRREGKGGNHQ
jgi:hypothetical protein